ncbi:hypothetical protein HAP94_19895 [Acidithiobacillus ferrivorans]|nr:hypothetical protein [Acidithiobacillus ferrivorans]
MLCVISFFLDHCVRNIQITQRAFNRLKKIYQEPLCRNKGVWTPWIVHGPVPMVRLNGISNMSASSVWHGVRIIEPNQPLTICSM